MSTVGITRQVGAVTLEQSAADRIRRVHRAAAGLRADTSLLELVTLAPGMACEAVGFDRALLCHVRDDHIAVASAANPRDPERAKQFARLTRTARAKLVDAPPELEAVTTQLPVIVRGADEPRAAVLRSATMLLGASDYVVAPIVHTGLVIGLLFADRCASDEPITELDCELLFIFATGLGWAMRDAAVAHMYDGESRLAASPGNFVETQLAHLVHTLADVPGGWARDGAAAPVDECPDRSADAA